MSTSLSTSAVLSKPFSGRFMGPFTAMGISGNNDLESSVVGSPEECAQRCLANARCQSFDYGARGEVEAIRREGRALGVRLLAKLDDGAGRGDERLHLPDNDWGPGLVSSGFT